MSEAQRLTRIIYDAFVEVTDTGKSDVRVGDIIELLRNRNQPVDMWYVMGEFSTLEALRLIQLDGDNATWQLVEGGSFEDAMRESNGAWETLAKPSA